MITYNWSDIQASVSKEESPFELSNGSGISIGSFDGIHNGHRKIIKTLVDFCNEQSVLPGVVTFKRPLPLYKHSEDYAGDISTLQQRLDIFESLGVKFVIILDFAEISNISGTDFLTIIKNVCNMRFISEGIDFRCGYKGATDTTAIRYWAEKNGVETFFVDPVLYKPGTDEEERISSSYIRKMISKGFFTTVEELLARKYELDFDSNAFDAIYIEENDKNLIIERKYINQILPPAGIYRVHNSENKEIRVEVGESKVIFNAENKSDINRIIFN